MKALTSMDLNTIKEVARPQQREQLPVWTAGDAWLAGGYGLPQTLFAVEAAIDELARALCISPFEIRRRNVVKPGDPMLSPAGSGHDDIIYGSYGLDQCLDWVERTS